MKKEKKVNRAFAWCMTAVLLCMVAIAAIVYWSHSIHTKPNGTNIDSLRQIHKELQQKSLRDSV